METHEIETFRKEIISKRKTIDLKEYLLLSQQLTQKVERFLVDELKIEPHHIIGSYQSQLNSRELSIELPFYQKQNFNPRDSRNEFTEEKNRLLSLKDLQWAFPRIKKLSDASMDFCLCSHETDFIKNALQLVEPISALPALHPEELDVFLVPGVLYTETGVRVGHGKGFYDRYLSKNKKAIRIGIAYEFQIVKEIQAQPWDQQMDYVMTPERIIKCDSKA